MSACFWARWMLFAQVCVHVSRARPSEITTSGNNSEPDSIGTAAHTTDTENEMMLMQIYQKTKIKPVVGILTLPNDIQLLSGERPVGKSLFWSDYVEWLQAGGADVVPLFYDDSDQQMEESLSQVNGVLLTGGHYKPWNNETGQLTQSGRSVFKIWRHAVDAHEKGKYFPLWGTCMGFQMLVSAAAGEPKDQFLHAMDAKELNVPLLYETAAAHSRLLGGAGAPTDLRQSLEGHSLAMHNHNFGVMPDIFERSRSLAALLVPLTSTVDRLGQTYVSTVEGKDGLPVYGTQWHPEKNEFEHGHAGGAERSPLAFQTMRYFARFFVSEAAKNQNISGKAAARKVLMIDNFPKKSIFVESHNITVDMNFFPSQHAT